MFFLEEGSFEGHGRGFGLCAWFGGIEGEHRSVVVAGGEGSTVDGLIDGRAVCCRQVSPYFGAGEGGGLQGDRIPAGDGLIVVVAWLCRLLVTVTAVVTAAGH